MLRPLPARVLPRVVAATAPWGAFARATTTSRSRLEHLSTLPWRPASAALRLTTSRANPTLLNPSPAPASTATILAEPPLAAAAVQGRATSSSRVLCARPCLLPPGLHPIHTGPIRRRRLALDSFSQPLGQALLRQLPSWPASYRSFGNGAVSRTMLANCEAAAMSNPTSAPAQTAFYQALLRANLPHIVVQRYQSGRYATNPAAHAAYQAALDATQPGGANGPAPAISAAQYQAAQAAAARETGYNVAVSQQRVSGQGTKDDPLFVTVGHSFWDNIFRWAALLTKIAIFALFASAAVSVLVDVANVLGRTPRSKTENMEVKSERQKARFTDVHGCEEAKEELQDVVEFLKNPAKFSTLGGKMPKGVLLVGPPGTGKTLLARAVAGEAGVPFFYMSGSEFEEVFVGVGAKRVRDLFGAAKAKSPAIIFIDELDAIGGRRHARDVAYARQTLNQLLTEMDGFEQDTGVIVIAATNFPEALDSALIRPGRFDRHVTVELPDARGRLAILKHYLKKIKAAADVNLDVITAHTSGLSGADLANIINMAAVHAAKQKAQAVGQDHLDWAKDKIMMGSEKKTMVINAKQKEMTAYHEAGHALVAFFSKNDGSALYKVTVLPRGQTLGHTSFVSELDKYSHSAADFLTRLDRAMGGKVAEEIAFGLDEVTTGGSSDLNTAFQLAWYMVTSAGMSQKVGPVALRGKYDVMSSETKAMVESEVKRLLDESYDRTRKLLVAKRKELDLLAKALVSYETLDKAEVEKVIRGENLKDRIAIPPGPMAVPPRPKEPLDDDPGGFLPPTSPPPVAPPSAAKDEKR